MVHPVGSYCADVSRCTVNKTLKYVGYNESKYCLRVSLAHPSDRHFAHVQ